MRNVIKISLASALSLIACDPAEEGGHSGDDPVGVYNQALRNGTVTTERPEVGQISGCTATLVAQDVAITAAHCVGYRTQTTIGNHDQLRLQKDGETRRFTINRYRSFSRDLGANDIAILGLAESVPEDYALAAPIAAEVPEQGTSLTVFGYGCTQIGGRGDGRKRQATYAQGDAAAHLCPGDSGGPVFNDETGAVLRINSGYRLDGPRTDIYGIVPGLHPDLLAQIEEWSQNEIPQIGEPLDPSIEICGRNTDVFETWTCTPGRTHRHRCLPGGQPVWEVCESGCISSPLGDADRCRGAEDVNNCGADYAGFAEWTCSMDDRTRVRCAGGTLEIDACAIGCDFAEGQEDACIQ